MNIIQIQIKQKKGFKTLQSPAPNTETHSKTLSDDVNVLHFDIYNVMLKNKKKTHRQVSLVL